MTPAQLRSGFFDEQLRALKALTDLAEQHTAQQAPDVPDWENSPESLECIGDEKRTPEEMSTCALAWQALAVKLNDILEDVVPALHVAEAEASNLRAYAKDARLALIELERGHPASRALDPVF